MIKIGHIEINLESVDGISESTFLKSFAPHYRHIGNGKEDMMKADYKELRKHFSNKDIEISKKNIKKEKPQD